MHFARVWQNIVEAPCWSGRGFARALALYPIAGLYALGMICARTLIRPARLSLPVICIGNITVGGSGKTPLVALVVRMLTDDGLRVGVVTSGYGRAERGTIIALGQEIMHKTPAEVGDETIELAMESPESVFAVADTKVVAAHGLASSGKCDVIVVDDGFQSFRLGRDCDIVALNAATPLSLHRQFPAGDLREPFSALGPAQIVALTYHQLASAQAIAKLSERVVDAGVSESKIVHISSRLHFAQVFPSTSGNETPVGRGVFVSGVANNALAVRSACEQGAEIVREFEFPDHFAYDEPTVRTIRAEIILDKRRYLLTTVKDWTKLRAFAWPCEVWVLRQSFYTDDEELLRDALMKSMTVCSNSNSQESRA